MEKLDLKYYVQNDKLCIDPVMNNELVKVFPWLGVNRLYIESYEPGYVWTWLNEIPDGWRKAFGWELISEINNIYFSIAPQLREDYYPIDIKEKYGALKIYFSVYDPSIESIIEKYSKLSEKTCICCGAPATKLSKGWISPWCDECFDRELGELEFYSI